MPKIIDTLAAKVLKLRQERGLSQVELADQLGVDRKTVIRLENAGGPPTLDTLERLAEFFNVEETDLVTPIPSDLRSITDEQARIEKTFDHFRTIIKTLSHRIEELQSAMRGSASTYDTPSKYPNIPREILEMLSSIEDKNEWLVIRKMLTGFVEKNEEDNNNPSNSKHLSLHQKKSKRP